MRNFLLSTVIYFLIHQASCQNSGKLGFRSSPIVTAECTDRNMMVKIQTQEPFSGIVNAQGYRDTCSVSGTGNSKDTVLIIPLLTNPTDPLYCGISYDPVTADVRARIEVHAHKILELEGDKTFFISCSQNGILGDGNLHLALVQEGQEVSRAVQGDDYVLRISYENSTLRNQQLQVGSCVALGRRNATWFLSDSRGCPTPDSPLRKFTSSGNIAEAPIKNMLRFQDSSLVSFQCEVTLCRAPCAPVLCPGDPGYTPTMGATTKMPRASGNNQGLVASTFPVQEPGSSSVPIPVSSAQCGYGEWVLALCITFAILFLIMLIVNIIMCSAISCNFTRKDQTDEVQPEMWGEYDTVKNAWTNSMSGGSIPGDRHSVHSVPVGSQYQPPRGQSPFYPPRHLEEGDQRTSRSFSSAPNAGYDHYAMVHRPPSSTKY